MQPLTPSPAPHWRRRLSGGRVPGPGEAAGTHRPVRGQGLRFTLGPGGPAAPTGTPTLRAGSGPPAAGEAVSPLSPGPGRFPVGVMAPVPSFPGATAEAREPVIDFRSRLNGFAFVSRTSPSGRGVCDRLLGRLSLLRSGLRLRLGSRSAEHKPQVPHTHPASGDNNPRGGTWASAGQAGASAWGTCCEGRRGMSAALHHLC